MHHLAKSFGLMLALTVTATAANYKTSKIPHVEAASFNDSDYTKDKKEWIKLKRKIASDMSFSVGDLSSDLKKIRDAWLKVKSGDEMEALLKKTESEFDSFSPDAQYFVSQMQLALPLRGIIWKLRPLFENSKGFLGNKSTHVSAVQAVRSAVSGLGIFLPTEQTEASTEFFLEPSSSMSKKDQFKSINEFQFYLTDTIVPAITRATSRIVKLSKTNSQKVFVWDNKIAYGRASFEDEISRFSGTGVAEMNMAIATLNRATHDILVYCAYNQDYSIKVAGEIGTHLGVDSSFLASKKSDLGLTDQERVKVVKSATQKHKFLELRNYEGSKYGSELMAQAYIALKNSVIYIERSYEYLQGRDSSKAMGINPILFQPEISPNIEKGLKNMKAVVLGASEVRDPVTGDTVALNLPAFYQSPPASLSALMATQFESGASEKTIKSNSGESLKVRNYQRGRSIAWDNEAWKKYVPSAEGKNPGYMADARRIIQYSFGTSMVFGLTDVFVH